MKRIIAGLASAVLLLSLFAGCKKTDEKKADGGIEVGVVTPVEKEASDTVVEETKPEATAAPEQKQEEKKQEKPAEKIEAPAEKPTAKLKEHKSENGFSITYPEGLEEIFDEEGYDVILTDPASLSSINIMTTAPLSGGVSSITSDMFMKQYEKSNINVTLESFEKKTINGIPTATVTVKYPLEGTTLTIKQFLYATKDKTFVVTYSEAPAITAEMKEQLDLAANSIKETK